MVADKLQRQEEERIQCSPTSNIDNMVEEEMDISTTHHKRKVTRDNRHIYTHTSNHKCALTHSTLKIQKLFQLFIVMYWVITFDCNFENVLSVTGLCQHEIAPLRV